MKSVLLCQGMEMTQFTFGDGRTGGSERIDHSNNHKVTKVYLLRTFHSSAFMRMCMSCLG